YPIPILYVLWSGKLGGAERHVYDLARSLPMREFAPAIGFLNRMSTYGQLLFESKIPTVEFGMANGYDFRGFIRFLRWVKNNNFAIIHDHGSVPYLATGLCMV